MRNAILLRFIIRLLTDKTSRHRFHPADVKTLMHADKQIIAHNE